MLPAKMLLCAAVSSQRSVYLAWTKRADRTCSALPSRLRSEIGFLSVSAFFFSQCFWIVDACATLPSAVISG
jgi:hypothetical protein